MVQLDFVYRSGLQVKVTGQSLPSVLYKSLFTKEQQQHKKRSNINILIRSKLLPTHTARRDEPKIWLIK